MSSYTTPLAYKPTGANRRGRPVYALTKSFTYEIGSRGSGIAITVPAGFETDLASIPWPLNKVFPPNGPWAKAAVVHDWNYRKNFVSRALADYLFFEGMKPLGVCLATRVLFWVGVRATGRRIFKKYGDRRA